MVIKYLKIIPKRGKRALKTHTSRKSWLAKGNC